MIREEYVHLFAGDVCAAAVLAYFEFLTNGEMIRLERDGGGVPWIEISLPQIAGGLMGMYSQRSIQDRLSGMDTQEVLECAPSSGRVRKSYLLNIERVKTLLGARSKVAVLPPGNSARQDLTGKNDVVFATLDGNSASQTDRIKTLGSKEEEVKKKTPLPPPPSEENPTQAPTREISGTNYEDLDASGDFLPPPSPPPRRKQWGRKPVDPEKEARRQFRQNQRSALAEMPPAEAGVPQAPSPEAGASRSTPDAASASTIDFPAVWNSLVRAAPVDPNLYGPARGFRVGPTAYRNVEFRERFPEICERAARLIAAGARWLNFGMLLRTDDDTGLFKWQRLLAGEYDFILEARGRRGTKPPGKTGVSAEEVVALAQQRRAERKAREAGTEAADQKP